MSNKLKDEKALLRNHYSKLRDSIPKDRKIEFDKAIFQKIINNELYDRCKVLLVYHSISSEIDTLKLIDYSLSIGKPVALPRCNVDRTISFYFIDSLDNLEVSSYGIAEPREDFNMLVRIFDSSLCVVPAFAYDMEGFRLGYGGGYYDRFLSTYKVMNTLGICYSVCLIDKLIKEKHDISIDYIMTESDFVEVYNG